MSSWPVIPLVLLSLSVACGGESGSPTTPPDTDLFPTVVGVQVTSEGEGLFRFEVTISSPYDTPDRYADAFRVVGPGGEVYGVRELLHDHANEQPFTRSLGSVAIPEDVDRVTVQARDRVNGWGGGEVTAVVPHPD